MCIRDRCCAEPLVFAHNLIGKPVSTFPDHALARLLGTCRQRHHDIRRRGPERAVRQLGDGSDPLGIGETDAGGDLGAAGPRTEIEVADIGLRVLLVEDVDADDMVCLLYTSRCV